MSESPPCLEWGTLTAGEHLYRFFSPVVNDSSRHRAMRFGGTNWGSGGLANDVWVEDLGSSAGWVRLDAVGTLPPPRYGHATIYDPARDRLIISGGYIGNCPPVEGEPDEPCYANDVWALSLNGIPTWQQIVVSGPSPGKRAYQTAIYDPIRDRMIVAGGSNDGYGDGSVWALSLASPTWTQLPTGPDWVTANGFYDPTRDRMVVLSGVDPGTVWSLDLASSTGWTGVAAGGTLPVGGERSAIAYGPVRDRAFLFGGTTPGLFHNDLWELTFSGTPTWQLVSVTNAPPPRWNVVGIYDAVDDQFVIFGGSSANAWGDTWRFPMTGAPEWTRTFPVAAAPTPRDEQGAVWDAPRRRMIVFGGQGSEGEAMNDLYALSVAGAPTWTRLETTGPRPPKRVSMGAVADGHDRMIIFGGRARGAFTSNFACLGDVWTLTLDGPPVWTPLAPAGTPPIARTSLCAVYDPLRDRMIVFGGNDSVGTHLNDTWALDVAGGGSWQQLAPAGTPPPAMVAATAVYDPLRDRMLVVGGFRQVIGGLNTVWALSLAGAGEWTQLTPEGPTPPPMVVASVVYDPLRDRVLVYGDASPAGHVDVLSLSGTPTWSIASVVGPRPVARIGHAAAFDSVGDRMIVFGGVDFQEHVYLNDALALSIADDAVSLTTTVSPPESGTLTRDPASVCFVVGATVTLTALPASGYRFTAWSGDASGNANPLTIDLDSSKQLVANFEPEVLAVESAAIRATTIQSVTPNPTSRLLRVRYAIARSGPAQISVVDIAGRLVATPLDAVREPGSHVLDWDAKAARLQGGIYFIRLSTADRTAVQRVVFVE